MEGFFENEMKSILGNVFSRNTFNNCTFFAPDSKIDEELEVSKAQRIKKNKRTPVHQNLKRNLGEYIASQGSVEKSDRGSQSQSRTPTINNNNFFDFKTSTGKKVNNTEFSTLIRPGEERKKRKSPILDMNIQGGEVRKKIKNKSAKLGRLEGKNRAFHKEGLDNFEHRPNRKIFQEEDRNLAFARISEEEELLIEGIRECKGLQKPCNGKKDESKMKDSVINFETHIGEEEVEKKHKKGSTKELKKTTLKASNQNNIKRLLLFNNTTRGSGEFSLGVSIKICSWNVNGFRNCFPGIRSYVKKLSPDILCLQELKFNIETENIVDLFDDEVFSGYHFFLNGSVEKKKGQHGTLIMTKIAPLDVRLGMRNPKHDIEGRIIVLEYQKFFLVGVYAPNPITSYESYTYRIKEWDIDFLAFISNMRQETPQKELIIMGDLNVTPTLFDASPRLSESNENLEHQGNNFNALLSAGGLVDVYRILNPIKEFPTNSGQQQHEDVDIDIGFTYRNTTLSRKMEVTPTKRLDYALISASVFSSSVVKFKVNYETDGSDHFPVELTLLFQGANQKDDNTPKNNPLMMITKNQQQQNQKNSTTGEENENKTRYNYLINNLASSHKREKTNEEFQSFQKKRPLERDNSEEVIEIEQKGDKRWVTNDGSICRHAERGQERFRQNKKKRKNRKFSTGNCCEKCNNGDDYKDGAILLLCQLCEDAYHLLCLMPPFNKLRESSEEWICPPCKFLVVPQSKINMSCTECNENFKIPVCKRCRLYFHESCLQLKDNFMLCKACIKSFQDVLESEEGLSNFFSQKGDHLLRGLEEQPLRRACADLIMLPEEDNSNTKKTRPLIFKEPKPLEDPEALKRQKYLLAKALWIRNLNFDDNLHYSNEDCPKELNDATNESSLEVLDSTNRKVFQEFKKLTCEGNYAPLHVLDGQVQGFIVQAVSDIPKMTLISEYAGDVDFLRKRLFDKNDSIMDLLRTRHSNSSLVICPETTGNIARFLSGINNHDLQAHLKMNVRSIRFSIDGEARVLLYACKDINSGDTLYYDYNAGGLKQYPTANFI